MMTTDTQVYTSTKPEVFWLDLFWVASRDTLVDRVMLLQLLAGVRIESDTPYAVVRYSDHMRIGSEECFGCRCQDAQLQIHHVIQVQHGGGNTPRNLVPLCDRCHRLVHPWLPGRRSVRGWWRVGDLAEAAFQKIGFLLRRREREQQYAETKGRKG